MIKAKRFFVFLIFSLCCTLLGAKVAKAYTLTLKPKFNCTDGKVMVQGGCISSGDIGY